MIKRYNNFISEKVEYHKELCPELWEGDKIIDRIENKLLRIARDFYKDLKVETEIVDIQLTGSLANYNHTRSSDADVHILLDFSKINDDIELVKKAFDGQRFMWNMRHNIIIQKHDVELYVQDVNDPHTASGLYSLMNHEWIKKPIYNPPTVDQKSIDDKFELKAYDIEELIKMSKKELDPEEAEQYYVRAKDIKSKIMVARKDGLSASGEFSIENLVFKKLRNEGQLAKLIDLITDLYDKIYSQ